MKESLPLFLKSLTYAGSKIYKANWIYYFLPSIIFSLLFYLYITTGSSISTWFLFMEKWTWSSWVYHTFSEIMELISVVLFEFIVLILLTPINSILSEKTIKYVTGISIHFSWSIFIKAIGRALVMICIAFTMQFAILGLIWLLSLFLGDQFYAIASFLNLSFFIGLSFLDFAFELVGINIKNSWRLARRHTLLCLLIGIVFCGFIYLPQSYDLFVFYLIGISIVPHLLTITATKIYLELAQRNANDLLYKYPTTKQ